MSGRVAIVMGSKSDSEVMRGAADICEQFDIDYDVRVMSAHRMPETVFEFARGAEAEGYEVIIAGAGGAAHLPGVIAALTPLPVIGVPVKSAALNGLDSLLSIVQMPSGVPVATVGIDGAKNAGLLAAEMLGLRYPDIRQKVKEFREQQAKAT